MKKMFPCSVGCHHAIEIERWEEDGEWDDAVNAAVEVNVWYQPARVGERVRNAWRVLLGKQVLTEGICLRREEAREMGRFVLDISSAERPSDTGEERRR